MANIFGRHFVSAVVLTTALSIGTTTRADLVYQLQLEGPASVAVGSTFTLNAYLRETATAGETTILGDSSFGLIEGSFAIQLAGAGNNLITAINGSPAFDTPLGSTNGPPVWRLFQSDVDITTTPTGVADGPNSFRLLLGSLSVQASNVPGDSNSFTFVNPNAAPGDIDLLLGDGTELDAIVNYSSFSTITAVPEPSSLLLLCVAGGAVSFRRLRKQSDKLNAKSTIHVRTMLR